jgi:DNA-binding transcriptional MerR regulator
MKRFSVQELAQAVQEWCDGHGIHPANGQAAEELSERTIRYYRTLGLLDSPLGQYQNSFTDKHRLQLLAIRIYQSQGIPLRRIRDELYGKNHEDLSRLEMRFSKRGSRPPLLSIPLGPAEAAENWRVVPLAPDFLLVSRSGRGLPAAIIAEMKRLLSSAAPATRTFTPNSSN